MEVEPRAASGHHTVMLRSSPRPTVDSHRTCVNEPFVVQISCSGVLEAVVRLGVGSWAPCRAGGQRGSKRRAAAPRVHARVCTSRTPALGVSSAAPECTPAAFLTPCPPSLLGYGFVDFDSPSAAQKAVTALKTTGVQVQMAKVRVGLPPPCMLGGGVTTAQPPASSLRIPSMSCASCLQHISNPT